MKGLLKPGEEVPSTQTFAETLLVSPREVAKAYRELLKEGFLEACSGKRNCISKNARSQATETLGDILQQLIDTIQRSQRAGLSWEEVDSVIQFLKGQDLAGSQIPKETILPAILRRLYFDSSTTPSGQPVCPYCREGIQAGVPAVCCIFCKTAHHDECWDETGHCCVFGCKGRVKLRL